MIKTKANQVDRVVEKRIQRAITQSGKKKSRKSAPNIIRPAIEELYKIPFLQTENFGRKKCNQAGEK